MLKDMLDRALPIVLTLVVSAIVGGAVPLLALPRLAAPTQVASPTSVTLEPGAAPEPAPDAGQQTPAGVSPPGLLSTPGPASPVAAANPGPGSSTDAAASPVRAAVPSVVPAANGAACTIGSGFQTLVTLLGPERVGTCVLGEQTNPTSGNTEQFTSRGLLVWDRSRNTPAFTDGLLSWYYCHDDGVYELPASEPVPC